MAGTLRGGAKRILYYLEDLLCLRLTAAQRKGRTQKVGTAATVVDQMIKSSEYHHT